MSLPKNSETKKLRDYLSKRGLKSLESERAGAVRERVKQSPGLIKNLAYHKFQERYRDDLAGFVRDCFTWEDGRGPTHYQERILNNFGDHHRQAIRGPHTLGKTAMASWLILGFALTHDGEDWKVPTTASVWRQLEKFLWPEVHKWARRIKWDVVGRKPFNERTELKVLSLRLSTGEAFALASDNHMAIEGAHADYLLYVFDEAKAIPDATWDAAEGAFAGGGDEGAQVAKALAISTPGEPLGRFYDIHKRKPGYDDWHVEHVKLEEAVDAGRLSRDWANQRAAQWGSDSALYANRVLGEFASSDEDGVIPLAWVEMANDRWRQWRDAIKNGGAEGRVTSAGCDVGLGGGGDSAIIALVHDGRHVADLREHSRGSVKTTTMEIAGHCKGVVDAYGCDIYIDVIGIGAGVYDRLREQGIRQAVAFNAAEKTHRKLTDKSKQYAFANKRSAMWWLMREMLDPKDDFAIALPPDDKLTGELVTPHYKILSNARIQVESKSDIRKRISRSTDRADPVLQALTGARIARNPTTRVYIPGEGYIK